MMLANQIIIISSPDLSACLLTTILLSIPFTHKRSKSLNKHPQSFLHSERSFKKKAGCTTLLQKTPSSFPVAFKVKNQSSFNRPQVPLPSLFHLHFLPGPCLLLIISSVVLVTLTSDICLF